MCVCVCVCACVCTYYVLLYSRKLWQALNLVNQSSECIGEFLIWLSRALPHSTIVYEIILSGFIFGDFPQNRQFAKVSRYTVYHVVESLLFV